jgi:hypothetical protein
LICALPQVDLTCVGMGLHIVGSGTGHGGKQSSQEDMPLLAAYMDVQAAYGSGAGDKEVASLAIKGLRAETQIVASQNGDSSSAMADLHGGIVRRGAGITQVCDAAAHSATLVCSVSHWFAHSPDRPPW